MIFTELQGEDLGVYRDKNCRLVQCFNGHIVFSYAQKGKGMNCHLASDKTGLRYLKLAVNSFCSWIFANYDVDFIYGIVKNHKQSVMRLIQKCNFNHLTDDGDQIIYVRHKWAA